MYIKEINLQNFRNYEIANIKIEKGVNIFYGDNAQGKTNILEAIFVASLGKSFRTNKDKELIKENEEQTKVEIKFIKEGRENKVKLGIGNKKIFSINNIELKKTSEIVGKINVVLFTPEDINILKNEPIKRRRFLNIMISQLRPMYIHLLSQYNKILDQRNNYLKQIKYENKDRKILDIWDEQLIRIGLKIFEYRKEFIEKINEKIKKIHLETTENIENIEIKYKNNVVNEEEYRRKVKMKQEEDIQKGYTAVGIHRDDFEIFINKKNVAIYGSQGQQRSSIISLKLAEAEVIYDEKEDYPVLLLDDFMSELDKKRVKGFVKRIKNNQVLITCTEKFDIDNMVYNTYKVEKAKVERVE